MRNQMGNFGCLFGDFLAPALVAEHTIKNLYCGHEQSCKINQWSKWLNKQAPKINYLRCIE